MTHLGERFLAGPVIGGSIGTGVGGARACHSGVHRVDLVARYFAHLFLDGRHPERCRLNAHARADAGRHKRPGCGYGFNPGVDARLHKIDVVRAGAGMGHRLRCDYCQSSQ